MKIIKNKIIVLFLISIHFSLNAQQTFFKEIVNFDCKFSYTNFGFIDSSKVINIPIEIKDQLIYKNGLSVINYKGKYGFIDRNGKIEIPCIFEKVNYFYNDKAVVSFEGNYFVINLNGDFIKKLEYDDIRYISEKNNWLAAFRKGEKWGFIDTNFVEVIPAKYDRVNNFSNGFAIVTNFNKKGFINTNGKEIISPKYNILSDFDQGRAFFSGDTSGYIDNQGNEILYGNFKIETKNIFLIKDLNNGFLSLIDSNGIIVFTSRTHSYSNFYQCLFNQLVGEKMKKRFFSDKTKISQINGKYEIFEVKENGYYGIFDTLGNQVIPCIYSNILDWYGGYYTVKSTNKYGLYFNEHQILDTIYDYLALNKYTIIARKNNKYGFINYKGEIVIPFEYDQNSRECNEGMILVHKKNISYQNDTIDLIGYYNILGEMVTPLIYKDGKEFKEGLAPVKGNDKWGFINYQGIVIIPFEYDTVSYFENNISIVRQNGKYGAIDISGNKITECKYDNFFNFVEGLAIVSKNDKWGFINYYGDEVIPLIYEECSSFINSEAMVKKQGKWFLINKKGEITYVPKN